MNAIPRTDSILSSRAMVAYLHVSQWSGRRLDREVTDELNQDKGAKSDASRVNKLLLPKAALEDISKIVNETRDEFVRRTLPWLVDGGRILPSTSFIEVTNWIRGQRTKFADAVDKLIADYPQHMQTARNDLGAMFKAEDYPTVEELRSKFGMVMKMMPVPSGKDFRLDLADEAIAEMREEVERSVQEATQAATRDVFNRIAEVSGRMVERLAAYKGKGNRVGVFRDSLVTNMRDLVSILPSLNITGDERITELTERLANLSRVSPTDLREKADTRHAAQKEAKRILDMVSSWAP